MNLTSCLSITELSLSVRTVKSNLLLVVAGPTMMTSPVRPKPSAEFLTSKSMDALIITVSQPNTSVREVLFMIAVVAERRAVVSLRINGPLTSIPAGSMVLPLEVTE